MSFFTHTQDPSASVFDPSKAVGVLPEIHVSLPDNAATTEEQGKGSTSINGSEMTDNASDQEEVSPADHPQENVFHIFSHYNELIFNSFEQSFDKLQTYEQHMLNCLLQIQELSDDIDKHTEETIQQNTQNLNMVDSLKSKLNDVTFAAQSTKPVQTSSKTTAHPTEHPQNDSNPTELDSFPKENMNNIQSISNMTDIIAKKRKRPFSINYQYPES